MAEWAPKVFWSESSVVEEDGGFGIQLDGRPVRTPAKQPLVLPTHALAQAVADEWSAQQDIVDPNSMPATRAANAAIDKVAPQRAEVAQLIAAYGETDLLCYRADSPQSLIERQAQAWDPLLDWAADTLGARLFPVAGVMPMQQDPAALAALTAHVARRDQFALTALSDLVGLSGSLVLGLAVDMGHLPPEDAWNASRIDESFQEEQWGIDDEAARASAIKRAAFLDAQRFAQLARA